MKENNTMIFWFISDGPFINSADKWVLITILILVVGAVLIATWLHGATSTIVIDNDCDNRVPLTPPVSDNGDDNNNYVKIEGKYRATAISYFLGYLSTALDVKLATEDNKDEEDPVDILCTPADTTFISFIYKASTIVQFEIDWHNKRINCHFCNLENPNHRIGKVKSFKFKGNFIDCSKVCKFIQTNENKKEKTLRKDIEVNANKLQKKLDKIEEGMEKIYNDVASVDLVEGTVVDFDELYNLVDSLTISSIVGNKNAKEADEEKRLTLYTIFEFLCKYDNRKHLKKRMMLDDDVAPVDNSDEGESK